MWRTALLSLSALALTAPAPSAEPPPVRDPTPWSVASPVDAAIQGTLLTRSPRASPGMAPGPTPDIARVRQHLEDGDLHRALLDAERIIEEERWGRGRTLASFVAGLLYREEGKHNLASESFTRVRATRGPLAPWAAYYEAEQDYFRGKPWVAHRECRKIRKADPGGRFDAACQRLMARSLVATGRTTAAQALASEHDKDHEDDAIREQIDLAIARRWSTTRPELAIPLLRTLAVEHDAPLTGRVAERLLAELHEAGHDDAVIPDDTRRLQKRAVSLRDAKRKDAAWDAWRELVRRSTDDPRLADWVDAQDATFAWRTHRWDALVEIYTADYAESGNADDAWRVYKALSRGGRHDEAVDAALAAQQNHGRHHRWRRSQEIIGRTAMLAGRYAVARDQFDTVARRGGWTGRRARLYAGISSFFGEDHEGALERLTRVVERNRGYVSNARYWRARTLDALGRTDEADADRDALRRDDPRGWYTVLLRQRGQSPQGEPWDRSGRWAAPPVPTPPRPARRPIHRDLTVDGLTVSSLPGLRTLQTDLSPWQALRWPLQASEPSVSPPALPAPTESDAFHVLGAPPPSYRPSALFEPAEARRDLARVARRHGDTWPEWRAVRDLSDAGLYDLSGPLMSEIHETWRKAWRRSYHPLHAQARTLSGRGRFWRPLFYATRDHHHSDRYTYGSWDKIDDPELSREALRLGWPLAHDRYVWTHAREHDVDPYLVMAIMRIESRYDAIAVSRVGARGAMQIMPRTGRLIADLEGDEQFLTGDLEDPVFAVGYGIIYLGRLLDRFDGAFPLAVASYNGGPFNVSSWLEGTGRDMPMDALVEHIPFRETRRYVRSVTAAYQTYLDLYAEPGTQLALPHGPYADDATVVDF